MRDTWRAARPTASPEVAAFTLGALMVLVEALLRSAAAPVFVAPPIAFWVFGASGWRSRCARVTSDGVRRESAG